MRLENKVIRLVPKKYIFYLFINYNVAPFKVRPPCLHTPSPAVLPLFVAFLERVLWDVLQDLRHRPLDVFCYSKWRYFKAVLTFLSKKNSQVARSGE